MTDNRERLYAAEAEFDRLTGGGRDLITAASQPSFQFFDGETVTGWEAAADRAEQHVRSLAAQVRDGERG